MGEQAFNYYLFGIYVVELGRFFKGTFNNFVIEEGGDPIQSQVFFGTPRAAFRYYMETYNGLINLPMINYYISGSPERKIGYEHPIYLTSRASLNKELGTMDIMRFPSIYEITYTINIWNNSLRERDFMVHALINSFPMGEAWLLHYPDPVGNPDVFLPMPHTLELTFNDETELEDLSASETRDQIRTALTMKCTRAFVPYQVYKVRTATWVQLDSYVNEKVLGNEHVLVDRIQRSASDIPATAVVLSGTPDKNLGITRIGDIAEASLGTPEVDADLSISRIGDFATVELSGKNDVDKVDSTADIDIAYALFVAGNAAAQIDT